MQTRKGGYVETFNFGILLIHSSLDGFYNLILVQEGNLVRHLCPHWLTTPKTTLHLASGLVSVGGEHRAKWKWDLLMGLVAWQRIVVEKALSSFRQFLPLH